MLGIRRGRKVFKEDRGWWHLFSADTCQAGTQPTCVFEHLLMKSRIMILELVLVLL